MRLVTRTRKYYNTRATKTYQCFLAHLIESRYSQFVQVKSFECGWQGVDVHGRIAIWITIIINFETGRDKLRDGIVTAKVAI